MKKVILGLLFSSVFLGACSNSSTDGSAGTTKGSATVKTEQSSSAISTEETTSESSPVIQRAEYSADFQENWNGLNASINKVVIAELTDEEVETQMLDNKYVVQVYFKIENTADKDFYTYPDQAVLVVEGQQLDAEMFTSDSLGGEILSGVTKEGFVTFSVPKIENVNEVKDVRLKWSANFDTDDFDVESHKDFDVSFDLNKQ